MAAPISATMRAGELASARSRWIDHDLRAAVQIAETHGLLLAVDRIAGEHAYEMCPTATRSAFKGATTNWA